MDISIIVPIYNVESYIEKCLRSLFTQTKTDGVEFILVNDATPDGSMEIARRIIAEYPYLNVRIFEHSENRYNSAARQTGFDAATGEYIIQVDSDDWCEPKMLEDLYNKAVETDADLVYCDSYCNNNQVRLYEYKDKIELISLTIDTPYGVTLNSAMWNKLVRRSLFTDNGIRMDVGLAIAVDRLTSIKLYYCAQKLVYLPKAYYHYIVDNSQSVTKNRNKFGFDMSARYVQLIEDFMIENNCTAFNSQIIHIKAVGKIVWLRDNRGDRQRECIEYFPEADRYILESKRFRITTKIPYFIMVKGYTKLANFIFNLSDKVRQRQRQ